MAVNLKIKYFTGNALHSSRANEKEMRLPVATRGEVSSVARDVSCVGRDVCCSPRAAEVCREAQTMNGYLNLVRRYNEEGVEWGSWRANHEAATNLNIRSKISFSISFSQQNLDLVCVIHNVN